ncbi:MAG TPA: hypothetical protein VEB20_07265 [Azospirillaceae bacterium]|nr:hypothetical protein [Azospirillaceae bacterium]
MTDHNEIHVGESTDDAVARVRDLWRRAEAGEAVRARHVSFESWEALTRVITPRRLDLLKHLRRNPAVSIAALARSLGRDYKRVHEDVDILVQAGLVDRDESGLHTDYDEIRTTIAL